MVETQNEQELQVVRNEMPPPPVYGALGGPRPSVAMPTGIRRHEAALVLPESEVAHLYSEPAAQGAA